jgi:hypothetical protein
MAEIGGLDTSSYPKFGAGNRLMTPAEQTQSAVAPLQVMQGITHFQQSQFDLAHKQLGAVNSLMSAIAQNPSDEVIAQSASAARNLGIPANTIAQELSTLSGMTPDQRRQYAIGHISRNMDAAGQIQAATGTPTPVNTGDRTIYQKVNPITNQVTPMGGSGAVVPNEVSPGQRMERQPMVGPDGTPTSVPNASLYNNRGTPRQSPVTNQAGAPFGALPVGQAPGQKETQTANAEMGLSLQRQAEGVPTRKAMFAQLENDLDKFTAGPGADWQNVAKAWANRNVLPNGMQFDPKSIASQEAFNKQATMVAQQQFQSLGGTGTNDQLGSAMKTSPNAALSDMGNRGIIQLLKGNEDAISAKNAAWQQWKGKFGAGSYDQFTTTFNKAYNPLVFQAQYMNPDEIKSLRGKLSEKDKKAFEQSYVIAKQNGWLANAGQ